MTIDPGLVERAVANQLDASTFSGVGLVEQAGEVVFARAYGYANRAEEIPNELETRFAQASGTRTFTALAVCPLVDAGRLGFDTPLVDCLDVWPSGFDMSVSVHHLLTNTSGVPDDFEALWAELPTYSVRGPADILPFLLRTRR